MDLETPYYLIDEARMRPALETIRHVRHRSGARSVLALKCFSSWCAFDFMKDYLVGTTSSSLFEARLGREHFGGETHGYSVAYSEAEARQLARYCDKVIFNSVGQLERLSRYVEGCSIGLRVNPGIGRSRHELSNPVSRYSRLGVPAEAVPPELLGRIDGAMMHINCENEDFSSFSGQLDYLDDRLAPLLAELSWLSLGGGIAFTNEGYPIEEFCRKLEKFASTHELQLYLEPGEAVVTNSTALVVEVLDIVDNEVPTAIVDAGVETHLLDVMTYDFTPQLEGATSLPRSPLSLERCKRQNVYRVCGRTCLAGDLFGNYVFPEPVRIGQRLIFSDVAGYSIVKKNFFNGISMPTIYHKNVDGVVREVRRFGYEDFRDAVS